MWPKKINKFLLFVLFFASRAWAQTSTGTPSGTSNPYSRYGLGELENKGFAQMAAMGRAFTAFENDTLAPVFINAGNPAALASLQLATFELGGKTNFNFLQSGDIKNKSNNTYLSYISFGFPLGRKAGMAVGVSPYSNIGYKISDTNTVENIGLVKTIYSGEGGLNQVFLGLGYKPFKNHYANFRKSHSYDTLAKVGNWKAIRNKRILKTTLSSLALGANGYFVFGDLDNTTDVVYPSNQTYFNTRRIRNTRVSDFYSSFGALFTIRLDSSLSKRKCVIKDTSAQGYHFEYKNNCPCKDSMSKAEYEKNFAKKFQKGRKKDVRITFGANVYLPTTLNANYSALGYTYKKYGTNIDITYDTTLNVAKTGELTMPLVMNFGMAIKKGNSLTLLGDVSIQNWSYYRFFGDDPKLKNSMRYSLGFQYINNGEIKVEKEIMRKKTALRGGLYYNTGSLDLKNTLISEYGITLGAGIPLGKRVLTQLNIAGEFGTWGTTKNNLVRNNFIRCTIGFTLNDRWFIKRVID